jgi:hypothetical protein
MVDNNPRTTNLNDYLQGFIGTLNTAEDGHDITYSSSNITMSGFPLKVKFYLSPIYMSPLTSRIIIFLTIIRDKAYFIMYSAEPNFYSDELQNVQNMIDSFTVFSGNNSP